MKYLLLILLLITPRGSLSRLRLSPTQQALHLETFSNYTRTFTTSSDVRIRLHEAVLEWSSPENVRSTFYRMEQIASREQIQQIRDIVDNAKIDFNNEPDTVDALPSHEIFVHEGSDDVTELLSGDDGTTKERVNIRKKLRKIMNPIEDKITKIVREIYPEVCDRSDKANRKCRPCYSLVRRYAPDERRNHAMHRDGQALVTVVMSLSDYNTEYRGGLYVATNHVRMALELNRGDAVMHQSDLLHGVQVDDLEQDPIYPHAKTQSKRWSWILWFKDSDTCEQYGHEWSKHCRKSNALCAYMYGWRSFLNPKDSNSDKTRDKWMRHAAHMGLAEAAFKIARNEIGNRNMTAVRYWLNRSMDGGEADAYYQLGQLILDGDIVTGSKNPQKDAVKLFRTAANKGASVFGGTRFAFYNMGVIKLFGLGDEKRNVNQAAEWFLRSEMPEGIYNYAIWLESLGEFKLSERFKRRAVRMGFGDSRRLALRDQAKFGLYNKWEIPFNGGLGSKLMAPGNEWRKGAGVEWLA